MYIQKEKSNKIVLFAIMIMILFASIILSLVLSPCKVYALSNVNNAVHIGNGVDLYDNSSKAFDSYVLKDLQDKLFDTQNPISYIKSNLDVPTNSYVVTASTINSKLDNNQGNDNGIVLTLGGLEWMVTSMTLTDSARYGREDIVVTLYLSSPITTTQFYSNNSNTKGNNAYSSSILRSNLLSNLAFSQFVSGDFATNYLVQPKNIRYQQIESVTRAGSTFYNYPNDALDDLTNKWHNNITYKPSDVFNGVRYDAWGNDYIWVPSLTEVGGANSYIPITNTIWKMSDEQRDTNGITNAWLRSGRYNEYNTIYNLSGVNYTYSNVTSFNGMRPAIHLNLSQAILNSSVIADDPKNLTTTFNEEEQILNEIVATNTDSSWYDKNLYENLDRYIKVTYPNNLQGVTNAGEYWIKAEIQDSWINAVNAEVDADGLTYGWTSDQINSAKSKRGPRFRGAPDTSDANHLETNTIRWFKITVDKAEIDFTNVVWSADKLEYNALNQNVTIKSGVPEFLTFIYTGNIEKDVNTNNNFYLAKVEKITTSNNNYQVPTIEEIADIKELQHKWQIVKKSVQAKWITENKIIDGVSLPLPVLDINEDLKESVEYHFYTESSLKTEITLTQIFEDIDVTQINSYWVTATFKVSDDDFSAANCVFTQNGKEITYALDMFQTGVANNRVAVDLTNSNVLFNGEAQAAEFNVIGGGLTSDDIVVTYKTESGVALNQLPLNVGKYKAIVTLKEDLKNFVIIGKTEFDYEISSLKVAKPADTITKVFRAEGFSIEEIAGLPKDWEKYFDVKVFDGYNNEIDKINGSWKFLTVNQYHIQIKFKNGTNTANGGLNDNAYWSDNSKDNCQIDFSIDKLVLVINGWQNNDANNRATLLSNQLDEIEKYFDYNLFELNGNIIIGNSLAPDAELKYNTNYQIFIKVKNEYKGNVVVKYNDDIVQETTPYIFKTSSNGIVTPDGSSKPNIGELFSSNGKPSIYFWVLIGIIGFLIFALVLLFTVMLIYRSKTNEKLASQMGQVSLSGDSNMDINKNAVTCKDWTYVIKENNVLNPDLLESTNDRVLLYGFKENDVRKLKKFQNKIATENSKGTIDMQNDTEDINDILEDKE